MMVFAMSGNTKNVRCNDVHKIFGVLKWISLR